MVGGGAVLSKTAWLEVCVRVFVRACARVRVLFILLPPPRSPGRHRRQALAGDHACHLRPSMSAILVLTVNDLN